MAVARTQYARLAELSLTGDAPAHWLSADEQAAHRQMRSAERQATWLAGRIVAKRLLASAVPGDHRLSVATAQNIHIETRSVRAGHGERPLVYVDGAYTDVALSLAHTQRGVLAAVTSGNWNLGVDLTTHSDANDALGWAFTDAERNWLARSINGARPSEQLWAMKEALYKACQRGEGFRPAAIEVVPGQLPQYPDFDAAHDLASLQSWRVDGHFAALAIVRRPATAALAIDQHSLLVRAA